jgi:hypothetical protein
MDGTKGPKQTTLGVNVFTTPGKAMVGERHYRGLRSRTGELRHDKR